MSVATFPAGAFYTIPLQIFLLDGITPSAAFLSSDVLTCSLWPGDDQASPDSPNVTWTNPPTTATLAQYQINFVNTDTLGYAPGIYRIAVSATRGATVVEIFRDSIELTPSAPAVVAPAIISATGDGVHITGLTLEFGGGGYPANSTIPVTINGGFNGGYSATANATTDPFGVVNNVNLLTGGTGYSNLAVVTITAGVQPPLVYCTLQDMQEHCSWIQQYEDQDRDETGFLQQRGKARQWLDRIILASWPGARVTYIQDGWPSNYGQFTLIANPWLLAGLDQGYLQTSINAPYSPRGQQATDVAALYSIALVLRAQMGPTAGIEKYAGYFMRRAHAEAANLTCELDINGDGLVDIAIPLSITNTRRG